MRNKVEKKEGFSLAELMLVLTVIGSVSSFVIPSLIQNFQDKMCIIQWKAAYSEINQANARAHSDYGGDFTNVFTDRSDFKNKMKSYFAYNRECEDGQSDGKCWSALTYKMNGTPVALSDVPGLVLNNGMFIRFYMDAGGTGQNCQETGYYTTGECGLYELDINGFKGPNTFGKDIYFIHSLKDRIRPAGVPETAAIWRNCDINIGGQGCGATYLMQ
jgi:prepilin-type N-terminal cleavage/methylation domain-containing protein